jgi:hypothetical protein
MFKNKTARIAAFVGAIGASAALIGTAATTTGAYFTDSENGTIAGKTGSLVVDKRSDYSLNFNDLVPGEYQDKDVKYATAGSTNEDIWLKFPAGPEYGAFTGAANGSDGFPSGGMGRYGHFAVKNNAGNTLFSSYNLTNVSQGTSGCADNEGHGFGPASTSASDTPPNCGVPRYILVESNVPSGTDAKLTLTFGVTGRATGQNANQPAAAVPFQVVATQHGVRPDASNF